MVHISKKTHYVIIIEKALYEVVNFQNELIQYFELLALGSRGILLIWDSCGSIQNFDWLKSKHFYGNVFNTFKLFRLCHSKLCNLVISNSLTFLPLKLSKFFIRLRLPNSLPVQWTCAILISWYYIMSYDWWTYSIWTDLEFAGMF